MAETLTKKQKHILDYLADFIDRFGFAPTYREIAHKFGLSSVATVHDHVKALEQKGFVKVGGQGEARAIHIVQADEALGDITDVVTLPLMGLITAGEPIDAVEDPTETINVPETMLGRAKNYYALKVRGESMIEDGILDGDIVLIERRDTANNGDVIVALLKNQYATLKRFYREKNRIRLQPANSTMKPIYTRDVQIQGKVIGLIRRFM